MVFNTYCRFSDLSELHYGGSEELRGWTSMLPMNTTLSERMRRGGKHRSRIQHSRNKRIQHGRLRPRKSHRMVLNIFCRFSNFSEPHSGSSEELRMQICPPFEEIFFHGRMRRTDSAFENRAIQKPKNPASRISQARLQQIAIQRSEECKSNSPKFKFNPKTNG